MCAECEEEEEQLQSKPLSDEITPLVQRQVEPEEEEEESIQAKSIYSDQPKLQRQEGPEVEEEEPNNQPVVEEEAELRRQSIEEEEEEEEEQVQTKEDFTNSNKATSNLDTNINSMRGGGKPLPKSTRAFFETRFGHDFSGVSVHTDEKATETAQAVNARAFTTGKDIVFGKGQYAPDKVEGKRLLGHELTHVVQQNPGTANLKPGLMFSFSNTIAQPFTIQRQEIPPELQTSVNHRSLTNAQLQDRYNMIAETLAKFNKTTAETAHLDREARIISDEIIRRETSRTSSLLSGRTFSTEAITRMRNFFVQNAHSANPINCIACMNKGLRLLLDDPAQRLGSQVDQTMAQLARSGRAGAAHVIEFNDSRGRMTRGVRRPHTLRQNVWDTLINMAGGDVGSSVFGLSIMDGNHSVTLTLDNSDPGAPNIYWSDQWSSRGGWQQWDRSGLNNEITRWTQRWWDNAPSNRKPRTRVTLWRLNQ